MPVRPSAADIANYNAWARRNRQPLWGGGVPGAAPAEPVRWRRGVSVRGQRVYAVREDGQEVDIRRFNPTMNRWVVTAAGKD